MAAPTLTAIHESQPAAQKLFEWILRAEVVDQRTTVEELIESCDVTRRQAITVLRSIAEAGHGEFKVGRKGHPSRLEWAEDPKALALQLVKGEAPAPPIARARKAPDPRAEEGEPRSPKKPPDSPALFPELVVKGEAPRAQGRSRGAEPKLIEHSFVLRPELRIVVELPEDLSAREAEVLGEWMRNLSFER